MTAHELARKLLAGPDLEVFVDEEGGPRDPDVEGRKVVRQPTDDHGGYMIIWAWVPDSGTPAVAL